MLLYGSLTGEGVTVGDDPRLTLSGRRTLEVYWLGYWLPRLDKAGFFPSDRPAILQLIEEIKKQKEAAIKSFDEKLAKLGYNENHATKRSHHKRKGETKQAGT